MQHPIGQFRHSSNDHHMGGVFTFGGAQGAAPNIHRCGQKRDAGAGNLAPKSKCRTEPTPALIAKPFPRKRTPQRFHFLRS